MCFPLHLCDGVSLYYYPWRFVFLEVVEVVVHDKCWALTLDRHAIVEECFHQWGVA